MKIRCTFCGNKVEPIVLHIDRTFSKNGFTFYYKHKLWRCPDCRHYIEAKSLNNYNKKTREEIWKRF